MDHNNFASSSQAPNNMQLCVANHNGGVEDSTYRCDFDWFPPGIRFKPNDNELIVHYLMKKIYDLPLPPNRFPEEDILKYNPQQLARKHRPANEHEWYIFSSHTRKYPNGTRPNRSAGNGFWKPTGKDIPVKNKGIVFGFKKNLEFNIGQQLNGERTNWKMHEYRLAEQFIPEDKKTRDGCDQLNSWILCKIYNKKYDVEDVERSSDEGASTSNTSSAAQSQHLTSNTSSVAQSQQDAVNITSYGSFENASFDHNGFRSFTDGVAHDHNTNAFLPDNVPLLISNFSANSHENQYCDVGQGQISSCLPSVSESEAASWTVQQVDNHSTGNGNLSNTTYHHQPHVDPSARNVQDGQSTTSIVSSSNLGTPNLKRDYNGYAKYPTSTNTNGHGSTEYQGSYGSYQQQPNHSYAKPVGAYQSNFSAETNQQNIIDRGASVNEYINAPETEYLHDYNTGLNINGDYDTFPNGTSIDNYSVPLATIWPSQFSEPSFNGTDNVSSQAPTVEPDISIPPHQNSFAGRGNRNMSRSRESGDEWNNSSNFLLEN